MKIVLATNNKHKIEEIKDILSDLKTQNSCPEFEILTLNDFPDFPKIEETGKTLEENAILKAKAIYRFASLTTSQFTQLISLADDSGLEVDALDGAPGVFSSRFAGEHCSYKDNNVKLLSLMENIPWEKRGATFVCVVAIAKDLEDIQTVRGEVRGIIAHEEKGENGFGYDPVFYLPALGKTFAQLSFEEKNKRSHRAKAFKKAKEIIENDFGL
ncbi:MAG: RdgB/HAM1 family non-canonical purine NTP pyrophosphatase [candidate division Zixibacteria bacterium]|nr:RdgB/HAM1 family non-canonical purine NTP pyrophosphatase [candidate division Zixibacteria bacterium]